MESEAQTLTQSMISGLPSHLQPIRAGKYQRMGCPFHGSENQRSLSLNPETGRFQCFSCGEWGYTEDEKARYKAQSPSRATARSIDAPTGARRMRPKAEPTEELQLESLGKFQENLEQGRAYLESRRIPFEIAKGIGAGVGRLCGFPQLVIPHTDPEGAVVSLYGRRIDGGDKLKHYHLSRPKGMVNAPAVNNEELWICEGALDCLSLIAAGIPNAAACFGVNGIRWEWLTKVKRLILAFDCDEAGQKAVQEQAREAIMRGMEVFYITPEELGGCKDINEAWQKDLLAIDAPGAIVAPTKDYLTIREIPPRGYKYSRWQEYKTNVKRFTRSPLFEEAKRLGWTDLELLGYPSHPGREFNGSLCFNLHDAEIVQIASESIEIRTPRKATLRYHKPRASELSLPENSQ
jgi:hypothetical protein|tara:strand:- start:415 stop:1632 length:1218 start_codon:yes stop_codon:yes gene_type:complete